MNPHDRSGRIKPRAREMNMNQNRRDINDEELYERRFYEHGRILIEQGIFLS